MADASSVDPSNGFCTNTKIFHSLRSPAPLPPPSQPLSITEYTLSLLQSNHAFSYSIDFLIDSATGHRLPYTKFIRQVRSLSASLIAKLPPCVNNQVALILSPTSIHIPVIYFSLLSLGITISPVNPVSTKSELADLIRLSNPVIVFATSSVADKLPSSLPLGTIIIDSPEFLSMLQDSKPNFTHVNVNQSSTAGILYSSGTTGRIKGVELTHRNFIAIISASFHNKFMKDENAPQTVSLFPIPLFHVFGMFMLIRAASLGQTLVLMERFDFNNMLKAVERYKVTYMPVSPPLVVAMAKSDLVPKYDLSSLLMVGCGGAPLGKEMAKSFKARFPHVDIVQGFGMTETAGGVTGMKSLDECEHYGSAGRLSCNVEAKIVDPETGEALSLMQQGELWLRGPTVMKDKQLQTVYCTENTDRIISSQQQLAIDHKSHLDVIVKQLTAQDEQTNLLIATLQQTNPKSPDPSSSTPPPPHPPPPGHQPPLPPPPPPPPPPASCCWLEMMRSVFSVLAAVPPAELERYLQSIPEVVDAAVIPYPDEEAGQIPMAYVVRKPGSKISETQIMEIIAKQVSPYKKIRKVAFINAIPKTPAGKILRRELVKHALSGASSKL
ncbi:4-coumarate--CoA ligase-like 9 [Bidens hawaiensis]|uniref:4-coumarate--CoA ligase-like 9 n=1 Tax=Bidens hawaiensis TaxID=980011 RepID=UPI00404B8AE1